MARLHRRGLILCAVLPAAAGACRLAGTERPPAPVLGGEPVARAAFDGARLNLESGRAEEALLDLRRLRAAHPEDFLVARAIQEALLAAGRLAEARAEARAEVERGEGPTSLVLAARVAPSAEEAEALLRRALGADPDSAAARHALAWTRLDRALAPAREGEEEIPEAERRDLEASGRRMLEETVADVPDYLPARADRAGLLLRDGDLAGAAREIEALLAADPGDRRSRRTLGLLRLEQGEAADAEREFRTLLEARPDDVEALYGLASALAAQEHPRRALEAIERVGRLDPGDPRALYSVGILRRAGPGDGAEAARALRECLASPRAGAALSLFERLRARLLLEELESPGLPPSPEGAETRPPG